MQSLSQPDETAIAGPVSTGRMPPPTLVTELVNEGFEYFKRCFGRARLPITFQLLPRFRLILFWDMCGWGQRRCFRGLEDTVP